MATIKSPYTKQLSSISPQRSAGIGRPAVLPQEYSLGYHAAAPSPIVTKPKTLDEMLYAVPQTEDLMSYQIGPGPGGDLGQAQGMPNSVEAGVLSQNQANTVSNVATGLTKAGMSIFGFPASMIAKGMVDIATSNPSAMGMPSVADTEGIKGDMMALGGLPTAQDTPQSGMPAVMSGAFDEADVSPPSSLADIGIGSSGGGGYGWGDPGFGISAGYGGEGNGGSPSGAMGLGGIGSTGDAW